MAKINKGFLNLKENYLFIEIGRKIREYTEANPGKAIIRMGIGDVTLPLAPVVVEAMQKAAAEMGVKETFKGYEDSGRGYSFLREAAAGYYKSFGVSIEPDEIFISDGAKSDSGNITDIFGENNVVMVSDPAYPVYVDSSIMNNKQVIYADATEETGFVPVVPKDVKADLIYLCSPNNPTGAAFTKEQLTGWVNYALENKAVIIYDAAYEAFISPDCDNNPRSIFAVEGARRCAIEICSLSKTAGFTGTRCGYTTVPKELEFYDDSGTVYNVLKIWSRRQGSKFNGVPYIIQRGAEAVFSPEGMKQTREAIAYYMENARIMSETFDELGIKYTGGKNSPYIWFKCNMPSWEFFDLLLTEKQVAGTPGVGFGKNGDGWFRLTAFSTRENTIEAMKRVRELL
ncbi:MAG: LL-diaminopimelate aminotransferase [Oscillospiraceae bacterium]|jgi:LL-diaminopimelate aminotransferase|nr:LL-diaminopimelate aminotransferase [Oscillospiraceae bacterium]